MNQKDDISPWLIRGVGASVCVVLLLIGYWVGIAPMAQNVVGEQALNEQVRDAETELRKRTAELERINSQARRVMEQVRDRPLELQPPSTVNARLARLSELTEDCGLTLGTSRVGQPQRAGDHRYLPVELGGTGSMVGVARLLGELHRNMADVAVQGLELTRDPGSGDARFTLKLVWFVSEGIGRSAGVETE
jgi:Tfp pilus assembly protein PilO